MEFEGLKEVDPHRRWCWLGGMKGVKTPPLGSDELCDQNSLPVEAEEFFPQGFYPAVLISLVCCPWQREQMGDVEGKICWR